MNPLAELFQILKIAGEFVEAVLALIGAVVVAVVFLGFKRVAEGHDDL